MHRLVTAVELRVSKVAFTLRVKIADQGVNFEPFTACQSGGDLSLIGRLAYHPVGCTLGLLHAEREGYNGETHVAMAVAGV